MNQNAITSADLIDGYTVGFLDDTLDKLYSMEVELLMDRTTHWGSWMWDSAKKMVRLGLANQWGTSIQFDTKLAAAARKRQTWREEHGMGTKAQAGL